MDHVHTVTAEDISSLMDDGPALPEHLERVQSLLSNPQNIGIWNRYHVIGDVLRSAELAPSGDDQAFWARLSLTLAQEPRYPTEKDREETALVDSVVASALVKPSRMSANDSAWRWKFLAGVSTVALVAAVGIGFLGVIALRDEAQIAAVPVPPSDLHIVEGDQGVMLRDPQLDQMMAAHQQLGGHSALQLPTGFLRSATFEGAR